MKQAALFFLILGALVVSAEVSAAEPEEVTTPLTYYLYQAEIADGLTGSDLWVHNHRDKINTAGNIGVISGASVALVGTVLHLYNQIYPPKQTTDIVPIRVGVVPMLVGMGGALALLSLPIHLWGLHLVNQNDTSTYAAVGEGRGWSGIVDVGYGFQNLASLNATYGYNFNQKIFLGLGVGCSQQFPKTNTLTVPAYLNMRLQFSSSRLTPYIGVKFGADLYNQIPYGSLDWGMRLRCKESSNSWWYSLGLASYHHYDIIGIRIARSF